MLLRSTQKIQIITSAAGQVDIVWEIADFDADLTPPVLVDGDILRVTGAATTDVIAAPVGYRRRVKHLNIANTHASVNQTITIQMVDTVGPKTVIVDSFPLLAGERTSFREGVPMKIIDANGMEKVNPVVVAGQLPVTRLPADVANSTTTAAKLTGLDTVIGAGTWLFEYFILYQAAAATTGVKFSVNHTGTVTSFVYDLYGVSADTTATATQTGLMDQDVLTVTGGLMEAWAARAKTTAAAVGPTSGVDTLNADMLIMISGLAVVTVQGTLELYHASEVAAATTVKAGTALRATKVG